MLFVTNYLPGAFAKAVIFTIEAVGTPPTIAIKGAQALRREQVRGDTPPGAFAQAVTLATEPVGTWATNANKSVATRHPVRSLWLLPL